MYENYPKLRSIYGEAEAGGRIEIFTGNVLVS